LKIFGAELPRHLSGWPQFVPKGSTCGTRAEQSQDYDVQRSGQAPAIYARSLGCLSECLKPVLKSFDQFAARLIVVRCSITFDERMTLLAQSGRSRECPFLGTERTCHAGRLRSLFDPKRTWEPPETADHPLARTMSKCATNACFSKCDGGSCKVMINRSGCGAALSHRSVTFSPSPAKYSWVTRQSNRPSTVR
jgi:hypothetical protein